MAIPIDPLSALVQQMYEQQQMTQQARWDPMDYLTNPRPGAPVAPVGPPRSARGAIKVEYPCEQYLKGTDTLRKGQGT